jgi:hypothetical protein
MRYCRYYQPIPDVRSWKSAVCPVLFHYLCDVSFWIAHAAAGCIAALASVSLFFSSFIIYPLFR